MLKDLSFYKVAAIPVRLPIGLIFTAFLIVGCTTINYREDPQYVYQGYSGTRLPKKDVATVWWDKGGVVTNIDDKDLYICDDPYNCSDARVHYIGAYLLPGTHTFDFQVGCHKCVPDVIRMNANLLAGHTYEFNFDYRYKAYDRYDYAARLVDKTDNKEVAGRSPDVLTWTWLEWEQALQKLDRNSVSQVKVIELLSDPIERLSDKTLVYVACKGLKGVFVRWHDAEVIYTRNNPRACGFLFLGFDEPGTFDHFAYIEAPFRDCYFNPLTVWNPDSTYEKQDTCRHRLLDESHTKFRIMHDRLSDRP